MTILSKLIRLILAHIGNKNQSWSNPPPHTHTHKHTHTTGFLFQGQEGGTQGSSCLSNPHIQIWFPPSHMQLNWSPCVIPPPLGKLSLPLGGDHSPYKKPEKETLLSWHLGEASLKRNEKFRDKIRDGLGWY